MMLLKYIRKLKYWIIWRKVKQRNSSYRKEAGKLLVRKLSKKDIPALVKLYGHHFRKDMNHFPALRWKKERLRKALDHSYFIGIFKNKKLVGATRLFVRSFTSMEMSIFVSSKHRSSSLGQVLTFHTLSFLKQLRMKTVQGTVFRTNKKSLKYAKLLHFKITKKKKDKVFITASVNEAHSLLVKKSRHSLIQ